MDKEPTYWNVSIPQDSNTCIFLDKENCTSIMHPDFKDKITDTPTLICSHKLCPYKGDYSA